MALLSRKLSVYEKKACEVARSGCKHTSDFNAVELQSIRATEHQSYRAKVVLQSIMNISHDCAQQSFTVVKTNFLLLGSITVMLQSIVYIVHDCANQIIMVVLQSIIYSLVAYRNSTCKPTCCTSDCP